MLVVTPLFTIVSLPVGGLNLRAVPGCWAAVNPDAPNREAVAAPPNGLEAVLVDPNSPPLLVLVPNVPKEDGLLAPNALLGWEKSPVAAPVLVLPNRLVEVPLAAPNPKPLLAEDVTGWLKVLDPKRPPGLFCVAPNRPPVVLVCPNADAPNPPVVPKPVFCCPKLDAVPNPPVPPPKGAPNDLLNILVG